MSFSTRRPNVLILLLDSVPSREGYATWCISNKIDVSRRTGMVRGFDRVIEMGRRWVWPFSELVFRIKRNTTDLNGLLDDGASPLPLGESRPYHENCTLSRAAGPRRSTRRWSATGSSSTSVRVRASRSSMTMRRTLRNPATLPPNEGRSPQKWRPAWTPSSRGENRDQPAQWEQRA